MKRLLLVIFLLFISMQVKVDANSTSQDFLKKLLRISKDASEQKPIFDIPEKLSETKCLQFKGVSSLQATRKNAIISKEFMLIFWVYLPSEFRDNNSSSMLFNIIYLGNPTAKQKGLNRTNSFICVNFDSVMRPNNNKNPILTFMVKQGISNGGCGFNIITKESVKMDAWNQIAIGFAGNSYT